MLTAGASLDAGTEVELIVLVNADVAEAITVPVVDGTFEVTVPADSNRTYIPSLTYQGVQYFVDPVVLTGPGAEATRAFEVYATTSEQPEIGIDLTIVTVVAIDRAEGQLGLVREDLIANGANRTYVGGEDGVTLRIPVPDGTIDAAGENPDGSTSLENGVLTSTTPIRAMTETSVISRILVEYDSAADAYVLRVTAPLPTQRIVVRVPEGYTRALLPDGAALAGDDETFEVEGSEPVTLRTVVLDNVAPGEGLLVRLDGFAPETNENVLTSTPGAAIAATVAMLAVVGASAAAIARRRTEGA